MGKLQDIVGKRYNHWTVLEFDGRKGNNYYWKCKCDCGTIRSINASSLKSGRSKCCGLCIKKEAKGYKNNLVGYKFNDFTVVSFNSSKYSHSIWNCQCKCGEIVPISIRNIGKVKECKKCSFKDFPFELKEDEIMKKIEKINNVWITNYGNVFKFHENSYMGYWEKVKLTQNKGYLYLRATKNSKSISLAVHRLVGKYFCEGYSPDLVIDHIDTNGLNNYYKNLRWVTQKDNIHHSYKSSGINQLRNYKIYNIVYPTGYKSPDLKGLSDMVRYIKENNLNCSALSLQKYGYSKEYKIERREKDAKI